MEEAVLNKTTTRIDRPEVAEVLINPKASRVLSSFMKREQSLSEAAAELNIKLPALSYWVDKLMGLELLTVMCEKPRRGKAVKIYGTTADAFFVPFELTSSESLGHLLITATQPEEERFHHEIARAMQELTPSWGVLISLQDDGEVGFALTDIEQYKSEGFSQRFLGPDVPAFFLADGELHLDFTTAKAMQQDLSALFTRYKEKQRVGEQLYSFRLGLTPKRNS